MAAAVAEAAPQGHFAHGPAPEAQENKGKAKSRRAQRLAAIKVPPVVIHTRTSSSGSEVTMTYERLHELGKGGFARCFQFRCIERATDIAGKVVAKASLTRERARLKLLTEIRVHRAMTHARVVRFESFFEDDNNVYMMMELCPNGSLADMVRSRGALSETEARGYMLQLVDACRYLHHHGIIHRDLKLGNVFLAGDMTLRVGDFGLATKLMTKQERKRTVCGTPNYIAPEVLDAGEEGHSFEVDVWSLGVILYTMLVGRPPFETRDVKQTYALIRRASFDFPPSSHVSPEAKDLVRAMLTVDPARRPPLTAVLRHPFFTGATAFVPVSMPASATSVAPYYPAGALAPAAEVASRMLATPPGALRRRIRVTGPGTERPDLAAPEAAPVIAAPPLGPPSSSSANPAALRVAADDRLRRFQHKAAAAAHGPASAGQAAPPALRRVALAAVHDNDAGGRVARKPRARTSSAGQASSRGGLARSHGSEASAGSPYTVAAPGTLARVVSALQRSLDPRASVIGPMGGSSGSAGRQHAGHAADAAWSGASGQGAATSSSSAAAAAAAAAEAAATSSAAASAATQQAASAGSVPPGSSPQAASTPRVWVVKWVDYTSKYGLGFLLSDGSVGVHFMDLSKIVCASDGLHFEYCPAMPHGERPRDPVTGRRFVPSEAHTTEEYPAALQKKVTLLLHFRKYLLEHWERSVADGSAPEEEVRSIRAGSRTSGLVYLKKWLRTEHAAVFRLSDRTVQACFFDGSAVALSPDATGAMFTDKHGVRSRHALATVAEKGGPSVVKRLRYVKDLLNGLVQGATDA
ncbi:hypothetical protein FNF29_01868 [Cafeteria roenbergensis]|uniref:Serine/threonine-protein kinase PLK n=1 Tax=Cafeteria roenbergensis TaxID=33653 RepID=A0A5A8CQZ0_CAFRO|nr:hypothetical protein FNF29_01868 [Cafeteria roenbergensis]|eukprot:KAA0155495.1 hypothetical protein FNF29_01868 [Cafeteria roenbergensis]